MCNLYGIYDKKASFYVMFFNSHGDDTLLRDVVRLLENAQGSDLVKFPGDFAIYRLGSIDEDTGRVWAENMPELMSELISYFKRDVIESEVKDNGVS